MLLLILVIASLTFFAPALSEPSKILNVMDAGMKQQRFSILHDGIERTYFVHVPDSYSSKQPAPLLVLLHGGGGLARRMLAFTGFGPLSEKHGIVILAPAGVDRHWNDGRKKTGYRSHDENIDDVGFIAALIKKIEAEYKIDSNRIFVAGISNGAMMSYRLGLELPDRIAAIAPVVGAMPEPLARDWAEKKNTLQPVPAIIFNGTDDPLVPFDGGEVHLLRKKLGTVISVPDTVQLWAARNGCTAKPKISAVAVSDAGMRVNKTVFGESGTEAEVVLYTIEGAGHAWPGPEPGAQYLPPRLIGRACHGLNATELIWQFFESHSKALNKEALK